ncbi:copper homeostasis protein CutC [Phytohabitans sp. ZYX-F-186]|uniref:PF03932 family protein CutC n=1 Tax=Phytohabitans maris TaxID=3071409 RepID=A0ABU0ZTR1_9ACTN|nr:copper homeostasis protein CutC [Phytohabitans sp. ZYX-F-186]MDQ7910426.1 copper homeostasis protein CutC [Phytohabitans sp. ZYX-F-186]
MRDGRVRFEVCVDGTEGVLAAQAAGADRVELCAALSEGGLTPSAGAVATALDVATVDVHVLVRPRGGDFVYDRHEIRAMCRDVEAVAAAGARGVVIGALTPDGDVDTATCRRLVAAAAGLSVTFHRAFDMARRPHEALAAVADLGVDRLLTSGQEATALAGAALIAELVAAAGDRLTVMPGAGVTAGNVRRLLDLTGAREVHFTARATVDSPARHRNPRVTMGGGTTGEYARRRTSRAAIEALIAAAHRDAPA